MWYASTHASIGCCLVEEPGAGVHGLFGRYVNCADPAWIAELQLIDDGIGEEGQARAGGRYLDNAVARCVPWRWDQPDAVDDVRLAVGEIQDIALRQRGQQGARGCSQHFR